MKRILLIGGTGFSGKQVLKELLKQGYLVTAITRNANSIEIRDDKLKVAEGNVLNPLFIERIIENQDAVVNCLGIGGKGDGKPNTLLSDSTKILVDVMENSRTKRLIAMSNVGAGDSKNFHPFLFRKLILPYFMKWLQVIIDDKNRMEPIVMDSQLEWTLVRCPNITDKPAKNNVYATLDGEGLKLSITNADLATFLVEQLNDNQYIRKAPSVSN